MRVSALRAAELTRSGAKPVCRVNGCERLCGRDLADIARESEVATVAGLMTGAAVSPMYDGAGTPPPIAKWRIRRCIVSDSVGAVEVAE